MSTLTQNNAIHRKHRPLKYKVLLNLQFHMRSDWLSPPGCSGRIYCRAIFSSQSASRATMLATAR